MPKKNGCQVNSSFLNYSHHPKTKGLGEISKWKDLYGKGKMRVHGLILHSAMTLTPDGVPLGIMPTDRMAAFREFHRCLKPGGKLYVVEPDSMFYNLHPQTEAARRAFEIFQAKAPVDLFVGRKLPEMMISSGFRIHDWNVQAMVSRKELLQQEHDLMRDRFDQLEPFLDSLLGGSKATAEFRAEFLASLLLPETTYYCNKFVVTGIPMVNLRNSQSACVAIAPFLPLA